MKKIIGLIVLLVSVPLLMAATGVGISSWPAVTEALTDSDFFAVTDVSDTTMSDTGTNKKATGTQVKALILSGLSAASVAITDAGAYFTGTNLETALQEVGASLATKLEAGDVVTVSADVESLLGAANYAAIKALLGYVSADSVPLNGLLDNAITDPADADDMIYMRTQKALTITDIYCVAEGGGSITLTLQECNNATCASPSTIEGAITCDADGAEDDGTLTDGAIAAGAWIKVLFSAPTGTVTSLAWSVDGVQTW